MPEGVVVALGPCLNCGRMFTFNPHRVPSLRWPQPDGPRQPICEDCIATANRRRAARGLAPFEVLEGAYEPIAEGEL